MKKTFNSILVALMLVAGWGCAHNSVLPIHDEVLVYPLPLDLTFLRTLEAVQKHPDWELDRTDKEKGTITIRNMRFSSFADADRRVATLRIKRENERETSVQFDPKSQAIVGGDEILALVREYLSREVSSR